MNIFVGTSGWTYDDWNGVFYPSGVRGAERLAYFAQHFDTVEVNATFYRFPTAAMIGAWNLRLPPDFQLVLKGSRIITHNKKLIDCKTSLDAFLERVCKLRCLRVLLWQLPPMLHIDLPRLEAFVATLPSSVRHAVEFRHPSWWCDEVAQLLARYRIAFVAISHPALPSTILPTTDLLYLRFHGLGDQLYRYDYSTEELQAWVDRLRPHLSGRRLYAFFNNDYEARAAYNAQTFRGLLVPPKRP